MNKTTKTEMLKELKSLIEEYDICITVAWTPANKDEHPIAYLAIQEAKRDEEIEAFPLGFIAPNYI